MALPDLVRKAIDSACNSGRKLSWKVQESDKGMLIQLVWKAETVLAGYARRDEVMRTNWNQASTRVPVAAPATSREVPKKRITPSRLRRNAKRLQAFLERKKVCEEGGMQSKRCEISANGVTQVEGAIGLAERTAAPHKTLHRCASSSKLDTPPSIESDVNDPRKSLSGMLEGAADVQYEARGDIPGVRVIRQDEDKEEWIPVVVKEPDDGSEEFDAEYLNGCKRVKFFMSESGPSFSIHCGNLRFPTPVACRTRSRLKDSVIS